MAVGDRVKELREQMNISQNKLAKLAGISQAAISILESGKKSPTVDTLGRIAQALGCAVSDLTGEDDLPEIAQPPTSDQIDNAIAGLADGLSLEEVQRVLDFIAGIKAARKG